MTDPARWTPDTRAAAWMGVSVFLMSWTPLAVALTGSAVGPFVFQFWFHLIMSGVWWVYLLWTRPGLVRRTDMWAWIVRRLRTCDGVLATLNGFNWALFVWATLFLDTALVTVITAAWLILFVAYQRQHDSSGRYRRLTVQDWLLMGAAMSGVAFVTLSQSGGVTTEGGWRLLWGFLLAVSTALCLSWISFRFKLGQELYRIRYKGITKISDPMDELACVLAVSIVTNLPGVLGSLLIGLTFFPAPMGPDTYLGGFVSIRVVWIIAFAIAATCGNIAFRYANLATKHLGVNAMMYLRPVLSLVWLAVFATITVVRPDWLWIGAALVISANALINRRSDDRAGKGVA